MNLLEECRSAKRIGIGGHIRPDGDAWVPAWPLGDI